jgi:hypothetical protein
VYVSCWSPVLVEIKTTTRFACQLQQTVYTSASHYLLELGSVERNWFLLCTNVCFPFPTSPTDVKFEVSPSFDASYSPSTNPSTYCANPWDLFCQQVNRHVNISVWLFNHIACHYIRFRSATSAFVKTDMTKQLRLSTVSLVRWAKPTVPSMWPATDVFQLKIL